MTIRYVLTFLCGYCLGFNTRSFFHLEKQTLENFQTFSPRSASIETEEIAVFNHSCIQKKLPIESDNSKINEENKRWKDKIESLKVMLSQALQKSRKEKTLSTVIEGSTEIERNNFLGTFDFGTPNDGNSEVLLLYNND